MDILANVTETETTQPGSTPQGALFVSVKNIGKFNAQFNGVTIQPGEAKSYSFIGKAYRSMNYDPVQSTLRILYIL
jgi:hypothetical protein